MTYNPLITEEEFLTLVKLFTGEEKMLVSKEDYQLLEGYKEYLAKKAMPSDSNIIIIGTFIMKD